MYMIPSLPAIPSRSVFSSSVRLTDCCWALKNRSPSAPRTMPRPKVKLRMIIVRLMVLSCLCVCVGQRLVCGIQGFTCAGVNYFCEGRDAKACITTALDTLLHQFQGR